MITVEDLLMAYASAYDAWLDPEVERKNPTPEYAEFIRQVVSFENAKLRELATDALGYINHPFDASWTHMRRKEVRDSLNDRMRELGIEVP